MDSEPFVGHFSSRGTKNDLQKKKSTMCLRVSIPRLATFPSYIRDHQTAEWQELEQCTFDQAARSFIFS
jgi:hypothetical protein